MTPHDEPPEIIPQRHTFDQGTFRCHNSADSVLDSHIHSVIHFIQELKASMIGNPETLSRDSVSSTLNSHPQYPQQSPLEVQSEFSCCNLGPGPRNPDTALEGSPLGQHTSVNPML